MDLSHLPDESAPSHLSEAFVRNILEPTPEVARERELLEAVDGRLRDLERQACGAVRAWRDVLDAARVAGGHVPEGRLEVASLLTEGLAELLEETKEVCDG